MIIENEVKLDFNNVLFRPQTTKLTSRKQVELLRTITFKHSRQSWTGIPILASNMDTVGTLEMAKVLNRYQIITCFHKFIDMNKVVEWCKQDHTFRSSYFAISTGITEKDMERLDANIQLCHDNNVSVQFICIDVANGHMESFIQTCANIRSKYPNITLIAGNVVGGEVAEKLITEGKVDIVKVGIGSGSVCTTRLQTGVGMPQLSAVMECAERVHSVGGYVISDGGVCVPGDISKAYGGGADFVMMGGMLAGHKESGGELSQDEDGNVYVSFYGMSSSNAMKKYYGGVASHRSAEGKIVRLKYKGEVKNTIENALGGVRSTCTYIGANRLEDIYNHTIFMLVNQQANQIYS